jgi:hypothetical protein
MKRASLAVALGIVASTLTLGAATAPADASSVWHNCTTVHKKYPHGVGRRYAHDHVTSGTPVTNFKRSNRLYRIAMNHNRGLDRDHDKIACEKH